MAAMLPGQSPLRLKLPCKITRSMSSCSRNSRRADGSLRRLRRPPARHAARAAAHLRARDERRRDRAAQKAPPASRARSWPASVPSCWLARRALSPGLRELAPSSWRAPTTGRRCPAVPRSRDNADRSPRPALIGTGNSSPAPARHRWISAFAFGCTWQPVNGSLIRLAASLAADCTRVVSVRFDGAGLPPVDSFWSLTMYDSRQFLVQNPLTPPSR